MSAIRFISFMSALPTDTGMPNHGRDPGASIGVLCAVIGGIARFRLQNCLGLDLVEDEELAELRMPVSASMRRVCRD